MFPFIKGQEQLTEGGLEAFHQQAATALTWAAVREWPLLGQAHLESKAGIDFPSPARVFQHPISFVFILQPFVRTHTTCTQSAQSKGKQNKREITRGKADINGHKLP